MVNYPPANFDANLEYIVTMILNLTLSHPLALALSQSFVKTFDDFQTIDIDDVHEFRYNTTTDPKDTPGTKIHLHRSSKRSNVWFAMLVSRKNQTTRIAIPQPYGTLIHTLNGVEMVTLRTLQH
jgi:hypothetical protein